MERMQKAKRRLYWCVFLTSSRVLPALTLRVGWGRGEGVLLDIEGQ